MEDEPIRPVVRSAGTATEWDQDRQGAAVEVDPAATAEGTGTGRRSPPRSP